MSIPLDHLAADLDTGYEGLEGGQRHRATNQLLAPPLERRVRFADVMPRSLMSCPAMTMVSPSMSVPEHRLGLAYRLCANGVACVERPGPEAPS